MAANFHTSTRNHNNMIPFIVLTLTIVILALVVIMLQISLSDFKKDYTQLKENVSQLNNGIQTDLNAVKIQKDLLQAELTDVRDQLAVLQNNQIQSAATPAVPKFKIDSFNLSFFSSTEYIFQSYSGTGTISSDDVKDSFLVLVKKSLKSGGAPATQKVEYMPILVVNGLGNFTTSDSFEGKMEKPDYGFDIVGYSRITMNK